MTAEPRYTIQWPRPAVEHLRTITDQRERALIVQRAEQLTIAPEQQGKPLLGPLARCRSVPAVGQRYRIVYQVVRRWRGSSFGSSSSCLEGEPGNRTTLDSDAPGGPAQGVVKKGPSMTLPVYHPRGSAPGS